MSAPLKEHIIFIMFSSFNDTQTVSSSAIFSKTFFVQLFLFSAFSAACYSCRFVLHKLLRCCCVWEKSLQQASKYPGAKNIRDWLYFWALTVISYYMAHWLWLRMMCLLRYSQSQKSTLMLFWKDYLSICVKYTSHTHPLSFFIH